MLDCDDGQVCTDDGCDPASGCTHLDVADGTPCADADLCDGEETCEAINDIFVGLGYRVAEGPEVETGWHNFDALNTRRDEPDYWEQDHADLPGESACPPAAPYLLDTELSEEEQEIELHYKMIELLGE